MTSSASGKKLPQDKDSARRGRNAVTRDVADPIYLKPLEMGKCCVITALFNEYSYMLSSIKHLMFIVISGWKRELVYRGTVPKGGSDGKRSGDIYYYTPEGKKVRSRVEILEYRKYF